MVPKADSGAFLLLFLLVLTVTEPLRPGARRRGWGRGRGWGWGRPSTRGSRAAPAPRQGTSEAWPRASGRPLLGHKLECTWVRSLEDVAFGPTSVQRRALWEPLARSCFWAEWKSGGWELLVEAPGVPTVRSSVALCQCFSFGQRWLVAYCLVMKRCITEV